jgi:hypothetical protein
MKQTNKIPKTVNQIHVPTDGNNLLEKAIKNINNNQEIAALGK